MKKITLFIFLLIACFANAQDCKYSKNEVDKFTKKTILATEWQQMSFYFSVATIKMDSTIYLYLYINNQSDAFSIPDGAEIYLLLENDTVVTLNALEGKVADYKTSTYSTQWYTSIVSLINEPDFSLLTGYKTISIRITASDRYIESNIKPAKQGAISFVLNCVK
jgi:hypothetical protein